MFENLKKSKLMFWSIELLVIATLIFVSTKIDFMFSPIFTFVSTLFAPVLIAGFLYYMLNPLVTLLEKKVKMKRIWAVGVVFVLLIALIAIIIVSVLPTLVTQIKSLVENVPYFVSSMETWTEKLYNHPVFEKINIEETIKSVDLSISQLFKRFVDSLSTGIGTVVSKMFSFAVVFLTVPFILFYMLKDGEKLVPYMKPFMPAQYRDEIIKLLGKMSQTISKYISGQALECLFVGICTIIGYKLIGVEYAFLFGIIAGATNMIPYLGPYLGLAPAVIVTLFSGQENTELKVALACLVVLVVQQVDSNLIYPNVIGKSLDIHPLTIIIILLVAGNIAGLLGMILGVPFYAICKAVIAHVYDIVQLKKVNKVQDK